MTAAYILRHPQTTWNVAERYQGRLESPLSAEGDRQLRLTANAFRFRRVDIVYSSPLRRALELAQALADMTRAPLTIDQRLTEIAMGPWEGLSRNQIERGFPELFETWYRRPDLVTFPYGEGLEDVRVRSQSAMNDILRARSDRHVCVVTHSSVVQAIAAEALGLEPRFIHRLHVSNASVSTLRGSSAPGRLESFNVTDHLLDPCNGQGASERTGRADEERIAS